MKMKITSGILLLTTSAVAIAQANGSEWPVAAASLMVSALAHQDGAVLALVVAPEATYFPTDDDHKRGTSSPLSLDSLTEVRSRCRLQSVNACSPNQAQVDWDCTGRKSKTTTIYSRVSLTNGKISSVLGDTAPQLCRMPLAKPAS